MTWTLFLYTARADKFKANDRKFLLVFVDADFNTAIMQFEKEVGFHPLRTGYVTTSGKTQSEVWEKGLKEHLGNTFIPIKKVLSLSQTLTIKQDKRCKNGYKVTTGSS